MMLIIALAVLIVLTGMIRTGSAVPPEWRRRYRRWENRPFFWVQAGREHARSARITKRQRRIVFAADRRRCIMRSDHCHGPIQVDHIRPWSWGGVTKLPNLMTLCRYHNVSIKSNYWPGGFYRGDNIVMAAAVLARERRARCSPLRWMRAGLAALKKL